MTAAAKRQESLDIGNAVRQGRAEIRVEIRALGRRDGALRVAEIVKDPPPALRRTYVFQLLQFAPFVADAKAAELLRAARVSPWRKVGRLTGRERLALAAVLERFAVAEAAPRGRPPAKEPHRLAVEPFRAWLPGAAAQVGGFRPLAELAGTTPRTLRRVMSGENLSVGVDLVDRCMVAVGGHINDLYDESEAA